MKNRLGAACYAAILALCLTSYYAPAPATRFVKSDSAVFLYIGQQIVRGHLPYQYAWDHKPPLIFYLDALGLIMGGDSTWGVWALSLAACAIALWLCYRTAARAFGVGPALLGMVAMAALVMATMEYANIAEVYALPLEMLIIRSFAESRRPRRYLVIGVATALLLLLRPNLIGAGLATAIVSLFLHYRKSRALLKRYAWLLAGVLTPLVSCIVFFAIKHRLTDLFEATFLFNLEYSAVSWRTRLGSLMPGVNVLFDLGLAFPVAGAALFALISRFQRQSRRIRSLVVLCIVDLALEMALSSVSGRGYLHYFVMWAPASALLCAYMGYVFLRFAAGAELFVWPSYRMRVGSVALCVVIILTHITLLRAGAQKLLGGTDDASREVVARYVRAHTSLNDPIYVWGYGPEIYVLTKRSSPSRYFMQTPLAIRNFSDSSMITEIVRDLSASPPRLIVNSSYAVRAGYPPLDTGLHAAACPGGSCPAAALSPLFELVTNGYRRVAVPGAGKWVVYALKADAPDRSL